MMHTSHPQLSPDLSVIFDLTGAMLSANPALAQAWVDIMTQSAEFVSARWQEDLDAQRALFSCKTPADALAFQSEYVFTAMNRYVQEAQRMAKILTDASQTVADDAPRPCARAFDDVPL